MAYGDIRLSCESNATAVRTLLARVKSMLPGWGVDPRDATTIELVLAETLNNIAEHAFPAQDDAFVSVHLCAQSEQLFVTIHDTGEPMPDLTLPAGVLPDQDVPRNALPEGGFGWFLIKTLTTDLSYQRRRNGNHLRFAIRLSQEAQPPRESCCGIANGA